MEKQLIEESHESRRNFLKKGSLYVGATLLSGSFNSCTGNEKKKEEEISPPEDLMREHGILNRVLLVYENCIEKLKTGIDFSPEILTGAASIIREFIEDYHEKQEEDFLFPRFEQAGKLTDLVITLRKQHQAGRVITDKVNGLAHFAAEKNNRERILLAEQLQLFIHFYRPHEAREDTVLFPALRSIISKNEFDSLGEDFEKNEHKKFGEDGFELYVNKVTELEKKLGIYDLNSFTPV